MFHCKLVHTAACMQRVQTLSATCTPIQSPTQHALVSSLRAMPTIAINLMSVVNIMLIQAKGQCWEPSQCRDGMCLDPVFKATTTPCNDHNDRSVGDTCHQGRCAGLGVFVHMAI